MTIGPNIKIGETVQLEVTCTYEDGRTDSYVTWSSSDETIATVDPTLGMVTGISSGSVSITATSVWDDADGSKVVDVVDFVVLPAEGSNHTYIMTTNFVGKPTSSTEDIRFLFTSSGSSSNVGLISPHFLTNPEIPENQGYIQEIKFRYLYTTMRNSRPGPSIDLNIRGLIPNATIIAELTIKGETIKVYFATDTGKDIDINNNYSIMTWEQFDRIFNITNEGASDSDWENLDLDDNLSFAIIDVK